MVPIEERMGRTVEALRIDLALLFEQMGGLSLHTDLLLALTADDPALLNEARRLDDSLVSFLAALDVFVGLFRRSLLRTEGSLQLGGATSEAADIIVGPVQDGGDVG